ncbi:MAG: septal ring lytic transglycosylase RlpA family protein [Deltaproteobacteria bacterium]|nr:septal ring lytic transglycosylase RlpA family protein [Deltaproteobacteria bacterium]
MMKRGVGASPVALCVVVWACGGAATVSRRPTRPRSPVTAAGHRAHPAPPGPEQDSAAAPERDESEEELEGLATYYGPGFHGRRTASGERFDARALTAAHRTLRFGTRVRVTSLRTGRSVVVRINDRGPFGRRERVIDLSVGAARRIGLDRAGVMQVRLEVLP